MTIMHEIEHGRHLDWNSVLAVAVMSTPAELGCSGFGLRPVRLYGRRRGEVGRVELI